MGQGVGQLGLGEALGSLVLDGLPNLGHSQRGVSLGEHSEHHGLSGLVNRGLGDLHRIATMNLAVQFVHDLGVVVVVVGQSGVDGVQSGILHRAISFLVFKCFPSLDVFIIPQIWILSSLFQNFFRVVGKPYAHLGIWGVSPLSTILEGSNPVFPS